MAHHDGDCGEAETSPHVRIFLSYSDRDRDQATRIAGYLKQQSIERFFAFEDEIPLEKWESRINREIRECRLFLLLYTTNSRESQEVKKELDRARDAKKEV
jgi:hypothetical protein